MKKKKNRAQHGDAEIVSLNQAGLDMAKLDCEDLERILGATAIDTCTGFSGPCPTFNGTCIMYSTEF